MQRGSGAVSFSLVHVTSFFPGAALIRIINRNASSTVVHSIVFAWHYYALNCTWSLSAEILVTPGALFIVSSLQPKIVRDFLPEGRTPPRAWFQTKIQVYSLFPGTPGWIGHSCRPAAILFYHGRRFWLIWEPNSFEGEKASHASTTSRFPEPGSIQFPARDLFTGTKRIRNAFDRKLSLCTLIALVDLGHEDNWIDESQVSFDRVGWELMSSLMRRTGHSSLPLSS